MSEVVNLFMQLLSGKAKKTPSGWISFNAPCCHNRGHSRDTRKRAGVKIEQGITYNCFNCKFSASWKPGRTINNKFRSLLKYLNASDDQIRAIVFEALKTEGENNTEDYTYIKFDKKDLPDNAIRIADMSDADQLPGDLLEVVGYLRNRNFYLEDYDFYWSPDKGFSDRVIIPFYFDNEIVGWTARKCREGKPKYLSNQTPNYLFNIDSQTYAQKYLFVVEGPFDAIAINGVATLTNRISTSQANQLKEFEGQVIVIPDQDQAGLQMIDSAIEHGFAVAFPNWDSDIKDVADAVQKYGHMFVVVDAVRSATSNKIKINVAKNNLKKYV